MTFSQDIVCIVNVAAVINHDNIMLVSVSVQITIVMMLCLVSSCTIVWDCSSVKRYIEVAASKAQWVCSPPPNHDSLAALPSCERHRNDFDCHRSSRQVPRRL